MMSETKSQWLVSGHGILDNHASLWALCDTQKVLLGSGATMIAENGVAVAIMLWSDYQRDIAWTQGRLFGPEGEIQWRSFGRLVRVAMLVDAPSETEATNVANRLKQAGLALTVQQMAVNATSLALQGNDDKFPAVRVYQYGDDREPAQFVRYGQILPGII